MNCTPQNLATLSSSLRALTDAQLSQIKTFLFCRWAQNAKATPFGLAITDSSTAGAVTLTWNNPSAQRTTNEVWKSTDGINFSLFQSVAGSVTQITDTTGMVAGNFFYYEVRSCSSGVCTAFSETISCCASFTSPNVATISFPTLVRAFGLPASFTASNLAALTSVSLPKLKRCDGNLNLSLDANLTTVNLNALQTIPGGSLFLGASNLTGAVSLPSLVSTGTDAQFQSNPLLTSLSLPLFQICSGTFAASSNNALTSVSCPSLTTVGNMLQMNNAPNVTAFSFPSLTSVGADVIFNACTSLQSLSLPLLTNGQNFTCNACPALTTLTIPLVIFSNAGVIITFNGDALNAASINQILRRGVVSGVTTTDFELQAGTNAAPSGQGVADKATLQGAGNTVNTN